LILWQIGVIGQQIYKEKRSKKGLLLLTARLVKYYSPEHQVIIYEASPYSIFDPNIEKVNLQDLPKCKFSPIATLFIPPKPKQPDLKIINRLGMK
jgi:hypothetical protein